MYYPSSENKGSDQLRGYREADLLLCFRLCRLLVFTWGASFKAEICLYLGTLAHVSYEADFSLCGDFYHVLTPVGLEGYLQNKTARRESTTLNIIWHI